MKSADLERVYYPINEQQAKSARSMWSMSEYTENSETAEYKTQVDEIYELGKKAVEQGVDIEKVQYLCNRFSKQFADWKNKGFRIELMCPSVFISGASNFPVRKKEKQNNARDRHYELYNRIMGVKSKLASLINGTDIIKSGDADALERLQEKIDKLERKQETMKKANAYYRKNKTLKGFDGQDEETATKLETSIGQYAMYNSPYPPYALSNNLQKLKNTKARLARLLEAKETGTKEITNEHFKVIENTEIMRLQLIFDGKPSEEIREILKKNGYNWSRNNMAWQRQLTNNARYSVERVLKAIKEIE